MNYKLKARYTLSIPACGYIPGHYYDIMIIEDKENEGYNVISNYDYTDEETVDLTIRLSNMKSIERYFETE